MNRVYTAVLRFNDTGEKRSIKYEAEVIKDSTWGYSDEEYTDMIIEYMFVDGNYG